ncbi:MAG: PBSX family phage terminase large subunit [Candidatus Fimenecus sp.]
MTSKTEIKKISDFVGGGYSEFWKFKGRYRVLKGSRASKKSKTTALWYASWLNKKGYEKANLVVFRKTYRTLKDSCYTDLKWAFQRLGVISDWIFTLNPLEATRKSTGQKILFRGVDDPLKITSITVENGFLCWAWLEEAYELMSEDDFNMLDESIRGEVEEPVFKQWTITFNPWNEHHWLKKRFFDAENEEVLTLTTDYRCNEWLDKSDLALFERMKTENPRRYQVAGLGDWGIVDGLVYENFREDVLNFITEEEAKEGKIGIVKDDLKAVFGLDFGYTNDPTALFCGMLDLKNKKTYVFDELYEKGLSNKKIAEKITKMSYGKERIIADSAEPKSIDELCGLGLRVKGAKKGADSINNGIQWIQDFEIIIDRRCNNFITEISNYTWDKDKFGNKINRPIDDFNHLMDAMRYAVESYVKKKGWIY